MPTAAPGPAPAAPLAALAGRTFDLLVVGGGINGAAIARDAALRGLSVCIVEARDWGAGTSARSSRLAHGGLRYLEQLEFGLVREALADRERLLRLAPHLVRPLAFLYPLYPGTVGRRTVHAGLLLYDLLSPGKSVPGRGRVGPGEALRLAPGLRREGLAGAATFHDAQVRLVERLVLECVLEAQAHGAVALNHTRVSHLTFVPEGGGQAITGAVVEDAEGRLAEVRARAVANATGCWVDETLGPLADGRPPLVRKTKGAHLVLPRFTEAAVMVRHRDGRTFFVIPWLDACLVGTTDTDYPGDPAEAAASAQDARYLADAVRAYFPDAPLAEARLAYAGVRALVNQPGIDESSVTRRHILFDHARRDGTRGLWSLQGGKITTARTLAEECVDRIARHLGRPDLARRHPTRHTPHWGAPEGPWEPFRAHAVASAAALGLPGAVAGRLVDDHGARWAHVASCGDTPDGLAPVPGAPRFAWCEVEHAVRCEQARRIGDVLFRRTGMGLAPRGNPEAAEAVGARMAALLGWDPPRLGRELEAWREEARLLDLPPLA